MADELTRKETGLNEPVAGENENQGQTPSEGETPPTGGEITPPETPSTPTAHYTYNPAGLAEYTKDRMRFELGDTLVEGGPITSPMCDEEYQAIIEREKVWKVARFYCLESIAMRLSLQADSTSIAGLSYSFGQRAERWLDMYKEAKKEMKARAAVPTGNKEAIFRPNYFYEDMQRNPERLGDVNAPMARSRK